TLGSNEAADSLGLAISDALITRLGASDQIVVRPTSATRKYTDPNLDPIAAGKKLQVSSVLTGSVHQGGDGIRVTVQLLSVPSGAVLWTGEFDEKLTSILALEDGISARVAQALIFRLKQGASTGGTADAEAFQLYALGRYHWGRWSRDGMVKSVSYFQQA